MGRAGRTPVGCRVVLYSVTDKWPTSKESVACLYPAMSFKFSEVRVVPVLVAACMKFLRHVFGEVISDAAKLEREERDGGGLIKRHGNRWGAALCIRCSSQE